MFFKSKLAKTVIKVQLVNGAYEYVYINGSVHTSPRIQDADTFDSFSAALEVVKNYQIWFRRATLDYQIVDV